jgi:DNA-binding SARP family transcriptional activator/Flp pilus assembly protein TadD
MPAREEAMKLGVLGPILVIDEAGSEITVRAARQRVLLAALLVHPNLMVPVDELAEIVWDGAPPGGAAQTVRAYVMRLRRAVGPEVAAHIITRDPGYLCRVNEDELDVTRFEASVRHAGATLRAGAWAEASAAAGRALELWRGTPLTDVPSQALRDGFVPRLEQLRLQALEWRIEADLRLGRHDQVIPELQALVHAQPLREHFYAQLMLALFRHGRSAEAIETFQRARQVLAAELGVGPGERLQDVYQKILNGDRTLATRTPQPDGEPREAVDRAPRLAPHQLPPAVRQFTGREADLARLTSLLALAEEGASPAVGVAAVCGTAGVGKTALVVQWAHAAAGLFPDGQLYVDLRGYSTGEPLPAADALAGFLRALGADGRQIPPDEQERAARYRSLLAGRRMLIVLDNAARVEQVRPLLPGTQGCAVLITSRDTLGGLVARDGAARMELDVLPLDAAVALLRELIGARVEKDPDAAATLAERCCRLPLVLRVAAEQVANRPTVPLGDLGEELAELQRRLELLDTDGDRASTVRAVFSWSYRLLDPGAARAFRLAALHPGADLDRHALAALLDGDLQHAGRLLDRLARAHLVHGVGADRYGMHDLLRAYARERAGEEDDGAGRQAAVHRLFDYYLHTAAAAMDTLYPAEISRRPRLAPSGRVLAPVADPGAAQWWLDTERANLLATAAHAGDHARPAHATALSATVERYLTFGHHLPEAVMLHSHALRAARRGGDQVAEATALSHLGFLEWERGRNRQAAAYQRQALCLFHTAEDRVEHCRALHRLALVERRLGNLDAAAAHAERVIALCLPAGDLLGQARALNNLGVTRRVQGRFGQATELFHRVLALLEEIGDRRAVSVTIKELGLLDLRFGRLDSAEDRLRQALRLCREAGNRSGHAEALSQLGLVHLRRGDHRRTAEYQHRALVLFHEITDRHGESEVLSRLARADLRAGRAREALAHLERALSLARALDARLVETTVLNGLGEALLATGQTQQAIARLTAALGLAEQTGARDEQAQARYDLARAHAAIGDQEQARRHAQQALAGYLALGVPEAENLRAWPGSAGKVTCGGQEPPVAGHARDESADPA